MQDPRVQRALLLLQQSRYDMAERELRGALADDPDESISHSLLAMCLLERQAYDEATSEAEQAIGLMPDQPMPHYAMAQVMRRRRRYADAERAIAEAIALDPFSSDYFAVQSAIYFDQRKWQAAKHAAEMGLSVDAEDVSCNNLRSMAMVKLGETADAFKSLEAALEREPENAYTHANLGWTKLEQGDPKSALNHFREALRLDPELDWARSGSHSWGSDVAVNVGQAEIAYRRSDRSAACGRNPNSFSRIAWRADRGHAQRFSTARKPNSSVAP
jgi:tetratricopeptide (TPR) repeat protein